MHFVTFQMGILGITKLKLYLKTKKRPLSLTYLELLHIKKKKPFRLCNTPATFQICILDIFNDMDKWFLEVFIDNFSVFSDSFDDYLSNLEKILTRCKEKNLVLN